MANNPINAHLDIFKSFLKTDAEKAFDLTSHYHYVSKVIALLSTIKIGLK